MAAPTTFAETPDSGDRTKEVFTAILVSLFLGHPAGVPIPNPASPPHALQEGSPDPVRSPNSGRATTTTFGSGPRSNAIDPRQALRGVRTPMSADEAILHLARAYHAVIGCAPHQRTLALLWAQWALETARGQKMWGFNFGGIKADRGGARLVTRERIGNVTRSVGQRFRTYATAFEGARDYVLTLLVDFPSALAAARRGSAEQFVGRLHREGYFTARPEGYTKAVALLAAECEVRFYLD